MKFLMFVAVAALIVGGIYHTDVADYLASLSDGASGSGGGTPVVDSIRDTGNASGALFGKIGGALGN